MPTSSRTIIDQLGQLVGTPSVSSTDPHWDQGNRAVIDLLAGYGIEALGRRDAPGVYVDGRKIASLGLRVRRGCTFHGLAFNVDMDLEPFQRINPCGFAGLRVTQLKAFADVAVGEVEDRLLENLVEQLEYSETMTADSQESDR